AQDINEKLDFTAVGVVAFGAVVVVAFVAGAGAGAGAGFGVVVVRFLEKSLLVVQQSAWTITPHSPLVLLVRPMGAVLLLPDQPHQLSTDPRALSLSHQVANGTPLEDGRSDDSSCARVSTRSCGISNWLGAKYRF
ncbi:unnamed protein product, partial [Ectocarpus sp. 12 AP-2014]